MSSATHSASRAMPALPGAQIQPIGQRACRHFPGQRVLASAGAEEQNIHGLRYVAVGPCSMGERPAQDHAGTCPGVLTRGASRGTKSAQADHQHYAAMNEPRLNLPELTVSELSAALKRTIEDAYGYVRVRGELGKVSYHSNGHVYFDLKDDRACIAGVIWRSTATRIKLKLEAGLEVVITGRLTTYPGRSQYQIVVETLEPAGLGALMALLEERKRRLTAEGLFDEARKQLLPYLPAVIGVITSPSGAVIRDILHRLADRFPAPRAGLAGEGPGRRLGRARSPPPSPGSTRCRNRGRCRAPIFSLSRAAAARSKIYGRSTKRSWCARRRQSFIPLISAVGHETDVTLIDFAADRRAPTPTAAAEMAVPGPRGADRSTSRAWSGARSPAGCAIRRRGGTPSARLRARCRMPTMCWPCRGSGSIMPPQGLARALRANAHIHRVSFSRIGGRLSAHLSAHACGAPPRSLRRHRAAAAGQRRRECHGASHANCARRRARRRVGQARRARHRQSPRRALGALRARCAVARGVLLSRRLGAGFCAGARSQRAGRCARRRPFRSACRWTSSFPTARSARAPKSCRPRRAGAASRRRRRAAAGQGSRSWSGQSFLVRS